ncbi:hypothetical protein [Thorsellia anophelis]|uniref:Uncharacterized protein n=1 Tax=Thorsellia anophelis DSM 18579 TaxID=1123402 RepID=A0A1I0E399_9GAMM|nr:hypothetical protein [Thorsellia anophelis]SET39216.1 hypothetical protein SAMN02583745_02227 [Thorsellia anophelis DSM 18579]
MILLGVIIGLSSTLFSPDHSEDIYSDSYDSGYEDEYSYAEPYSDCTAGELTTENGKTTQTFCQWDESGALKLNSITRSDTETELNLTLVGDGYSGFCVWPVASESAFRLVDTDTGAELILKDQVSEISSCADQDPDTRFMYPSYGEEYELKLVFDALPSTAINMKLVEHVEEEGVNPTAINNITLLPLE